MCWCQQHQDRYRRCLLLNGQRIPLLISQQGGRNPAPQEEAIQGIPSSPTASILDREQPPIDRHALEGVLAASGKAEARPGDQVDDDARDKHLARHGRCCNTRGDVDGDAADVVVAQPLEGFMFVDRPSST